MSKKAMRNNNREEMKLIQWRKMKKKNKKETPNNLRRKKKTSLPLRIEKAYPVALKAKEEKVMQALKNRRKCKRILIKALLGKPMNQSSLVRKQNWIG